MALIAVTQEQVIELDVASCAITPDGNTKG